MFWPGCYCYSFNTICSNHKVVKSSVADITFGVPQDSVFYNLFIPDTAQKVQCKILHYPDNMEIKIEN